MAEIVVKDRQYIYHLTKEQADTLKEHCTLSNPKHEAALKFSKYSYTRIPKYLYYWEERAEKDTEGNTLKVLTVPSGVNVSEVLGRKVFSVSQQEEVSVKYPDFLFDLREAQREAEASYLRSYEEQDQHHPGVIHLPTGKGKTILALHIAYILRQKCLVLVHKNDLVVGWQKDIKDVFGGKVKPGLIKAKSFKIGEQITIATVQTLSKLPQDKVKELVKTFGMIVQDEVHHVAATTFNIVDKFYAKYKIGLSATPKRSDGLTECLNYFYGGLCYKYQYKSGDEDICDVVVHIKNARYKFLPILVGGSVYNYYSFNKINLPEDYILLEDIPYEQRPQVSYLNLVDSMVQDIDYLNQVCNDAYKEYQQGHSVLMLFTHKEHIERYYNAFLEYVPEERLIMYYGDSRESDKELLERAESERQTITFATYAKATEGTNVKRWEVLFLVGSLNNEKNTEQALGRIRRRMEGKLNPVRVYDYYTDTYSLRGHLATRLKTYHKLKLTVDNKSAYKESLFQRGRLTE